MRIICRRKIRFIAFGVLIFFGALIVSSPDAAASRDVLWEIVTNCLDLSVQDYCAQCRTPRSEKSCSQKRICENTLEVWSENNNYVVIRDRKMCDCPSTFVHGIAIPRARVTGVEDPRRPDGIWAFAWSVARMRISDESAIALVVNPPHSRSQDQLHVHIVRLQKDARQRFNKVNVLRVQSLDEVWSTAKRYATDIKLNDYGVLVASHHDGGFIVVVNENNLERIYTERACR
jgi:CDP-diacylglycerol pyrophosphatase